MQLILNEHLTGFLEYRNISCENVQLPDAKLVAANIKVMIISEVPPKAPCDCFYSKSKNPEFLQTTLSLFQKAGVSVAGMEDIIAKGIYNTTAVKSPKEKYSVDNAYMRCGKKASNMIAKKQTKKTPFPAG